MKIIRGIKLGGIQNKLFNLILVFILILVGAYIGVSAYQQSNLSRIVQEAGAEQQEAITGVSEETMSAVLDSTMAKETALQAYIADELFAEVRTDVMTLQAFASGLFEHKEMFSPHPVPAPDAASDGIPMVQMLHEEGVDPEASELAGLAGNMGDIMLAMYNNSDKLSSCFVATADGVIIYTDDREASYVSESGEVYPFDVRNRPWYIQAVSEGELIFTGVESDAYTDIPGVVCAAPVYYDGNLVAVVGADIFLSSVRDYVDGTATEGGFVCVINENGQVIFSPQSEGIFKAELSSKASDLRKNENAELAAFISAAMSENTGLNEISADGRDYYMAGSPMATIGWTVVSVVYREIAHAPTDAMLTRYDAIKDEALGSYSEGAANSARTFLVLTLVILLLAITAALIMASRIVKPLERMTARINELSGSDNSFEMENIYRTGDEIEILAKSFETLSKRTRDYITRITEITAEKERIGTELALANRIQADMLPSLFPPFPDRKDFDVFAKMVPAKEVGGDFFDFFLTDDDHLGLVMADVSGKGVPAALFMMASKILVQNYTMMGYTPKEVLRAVNDQICSGNHEDMFVTVWLGILDLKTGKLVASNAGHEYPMIMAPGGEFELIKDPHSLIVGGIEGVKYKEYELELSPGSKLFLYTDGVPEAADANNNLFGNERLISALNSFREQGPKDILEGVYGAVTAFSGEAPQFDDITMLCLDYRGQENAGGTDVKEILIDAKPENLPELTDFAEKFLDEIGCPLKTKLQIDVMLDEIFTNIVSYAYAPGEGKARISFKCLEGPRRAVITFADRGIPFDPTKAEEPDISLPAEKRKIGGLGILMVRKSMDDVRYEHKNGQNILTVIKKF
ncbi:MAG: SpoIIE family protein phosphatase [Oscillospiraceae bacterium]|nr:SpoIIE family protein phosphatase [Oscillospiraceae bacterium]